MFWVVKRRGNIYGEVYALHTVNFQFYTFTTESMNTTTYGFVVPSTTSVAHVIPGMTISSSKINLCYYGEELKEKEGNK